MQLLFCRDIILQIKYTTYWELLSQEKHLQIIKDDIRKNSKTVEHEYKVVDKIILINDSDTNMKRHIPGHL